MISLKRTLVSVATLLVGASLLTGCNTVKGTAEGASEDVTAVANAVEPAPIYRHHRYCDHHYCRHHHRHHHPVMHKKVVKRVASDENMNEDMNSNTPTTEPAVQDNANKMN